MLENNHSFVTGKILKSYILNQITIKELYQKWYI